MTKLLADFKIPGLAPGMTGENHRLYEIPGLTPGMTGDITRLSGRNEVQTRNLL